MGSAPDPELLVRVALAIGLTSLVLAAGTVLQILAMRRRRLRRQARVDRFLEVWRPRVYEAALGEPPRALPPLAAEDDVTFLLLWNQVQEGLRGPPRTGLNQLARMVGARVIALRRLDAADPTARLLALRTLGYFGELEDFWRVAAYLDDRSIAHRPGGGPGPGPHRSAPRRRRHLAAPPPPPRLADGPGGHHAAGGPTPPPSATPWCGRSAELAAAGAAAAAPARGAHGRRPGRRGGEHAPRHLRGPGQPGRGAAPRPQPGPAPRRGPAGRATRPGRSAPRRPRRWGGSAGRRSAPSSCRAPRRPAVVGPLPGRPGAAGRALRRPRGGGGAGGSASPTASPATCWPTCWRRATGDLHAALEGAQWFFLAYVVLLHLAYFALDAVSIHVIGREVEATAGNVLPVAFSGLEPPITLLVPAYNEEATIAASLWSLLQLEYPSFEIVVVNDGSKDRTLEVLVEEFGLDARSRRPTGSPSRPGRCGPSTGPPASPPCGSSTRRTAARPTPSTPPSTPSRCPLVCVVDADSVLQRDSLQRIVRPLLEDADRGGRRRHHPPRQRLPGLRGVRGAGGPAAELAGPHPGGGVPARLPLRPHGLVAHERAADHLRRLRGLPQAGAGGGGRLPDRHHRRGHGAGGAAPPARTGWRGGPTGSSTCPTRSAGPRPPRPSQVLRGQRIRWQRGPAGEPGRQPRAPLPPPRRHPRLAGLPGHAPLRGHRPGGGDGRLGALGGGGAAGRHLLARHGRAAGGGARAVGCSSR